MQSILENGQTTPKFRLDADFVRKYSKITAPFGFNGLGALTYRRTYSRIKENGFNETWFETVERVVNGIYNMQKEWVESRGLGWEDAKAQKSAQEMYDAIFMMRFTPPGRGLWAAGTGIIEERKIYAALNNCAFISTENIAKERDMAFRFLMDMSMLGVGCGFDVRGAGKILVKNPKKFKEYSPPDEDVEIVYKPNPVKSQILQKYIEFLQAQIEIVTERISGAKSEYEKSSAGGDLQMYNVELGWAQSLDVRGIQTYVIDDSREGWVEATGRIIRTYLRGDDEPVYPIVFDYSQIRKKGLPLRTFGGKSSGPEPLLDLHIMCRVVLGENSGSNITGRTIVDLMNLIGKCVIAGNVRRTAEIALGEYDDEEFINLKNYTKNPERVSYGWCSNNSVFGHLGMDYTDIAKRIVDNGEPGIVWMDNIHDFSRMNGIPDYKDIRAVGTNPSLRAGTKILTTEGIVPIEQLQDKEFKVYNLNGQQSPAKCWLSGKNKQLYKVTLKTGRSYYATAEHEWPVFSDENSGGFYTKVKTSELLSGQYLPTPSKRTKLSEGTVGTYMDGREFSWQFVERLNAEKNGLPASIWKEASEQFRKGFINGLFSAAESVTLNDTEIQFSVDNKRLIEDLSELLGFYGIKNTVVYAYENTYQLSISDRESIEWFQHLFQVQVDKKDSKTTEISSVDSKISLLNPENWVEITSVETTDLYEDVWDISVFDNTHCFTLAHCITGNCSEQSLENAEYCTLVEVFIGRCKSKEEFLRTLKFAYLYAKTITLGQSHWPETNRAMMRNRRIGCSLTGITQFLHDHGIEKLREWCEEGYNTIQHWDEIYSNWFCIPRSIKTTSIKPSGCLTPDSRVKVVEIGGECASTDENSEFIKTGTKMHNMTLKDIFVHYGHDLAEFDEDKRGWLEIPSNNSAPKLYVFNANNELEPISRLYCNGVAEIYEVPLADGSVVKCTAEHKWLVQKGIDQIWKKTADLEEGDMIVKF